MRVTVKLFARLKDIVGGADVIREIEAPATVGDVWAQLTREFPTLSEYTTSISAAVNMEYARPSTPVSEGDEIAFLPPVSGGYR